MKKNVLHTLLVLLSVFCLTGCTKQPKVNKHDPYFEKQLPVYAQNALQSAKKNRLNTEYCILVDYSLPSGKERVFLWSFKENKVIYKAHTMHGSGGGSTEKNAVLSNVSGSNCSAPGHFKITHDQGAKIRPSFRLQGLDGANSNSYVRGIMLHGARLVDVSLAMKLKYFPLDVKWCAGCVTVSTKEMAYLKDFIKSQKGHMLLYTFKS